MEAFITGIGWISKISMGNMAGIQEFSQNTTLPQIKRKDVLSHPYKPFGRMDEFSKLGFTAIAFAMEDAGIKIDPERIQQGKIQQGKKNISMIASTVTGCLETDMNFQETMLRTLPSPAVFAYTLDSSFLGEASIYWGMTGESFVINEEKTNGLKGLFMALEIITSGGSDIVLCGLCNSRIKTIDTDFDIVDTGSLFFVIQKESPHSYGMIKSNSMKSSYYQNDIKITGLHDLAQKCTNQRYEHCKD
jgi:3-oxoacyl-(acyl-carrier-protein) synthase